MIFKKHSLFIYVALLSCTVNFAQIDEPETGSFWSKTYTGGNLSMNFGRVTYIDISPILGYRVTNDFSTGVGLKYVYIKYNTAPVQQTSMYGGSVFSRYLFLENFLAHAEFEAISVETLEPFTGKLKRKLVPVGLIGGGYRNNIGRYSYMQVMLLYDLIGDKNSPYRGSSIFGIDSRVYLRMGITIGL